MPAGNEEKEELTSADTSPLKGPAPKAQPEDTSDVDKNEDIMPLTSPPDQTVQFVPSNGDAKVELGDIPASPPAFVGLGKEELMKYANDPFWVRLRWFLFIMFWVLWVAMLVGAIIIIVLAPKCSEKNKNLESVYEINVNDFMKDGKTIDLDQRVEYLKNLGVDSVIISDVLKKEDGGVVDFTDVDPSIGTVENFEEAIVQLKDYFHGLKVLLELVPNHSGLRHPWFTNAAENKDYYVRKPSGEVFGSTWTEVGTRRSAWQDDPSNNTVKYLQLFQDSADLNFHNEKVVEKITDAFSFWKQKGVDGFYIGAASYLLEDLSALSDPYAVKNQPGNLKLLKRFIEGVDEDVHSYAELEELDASQKNKYIKAGITPVDSYFDYAKTNSQSNSTESKITFFKQLHLSRGGVIRLRKMNVNPEEWDLVNFMAFSSNASVISQFDPDSVKDANSAASKFIHDLSEAQKKEVGEESEYTYPFVEGKEVFAFARAKLIGLVNFGSLEATINVRKDFQVAEDSQMNIIVATPNLHLNQTENIADEITLVGRSGVLIEKTG